MRAIFILVCVANIILAQGKLKKGSGNANWEQLDDDVNRNGCAGYKKPDRGVFWSRKRGLGWIGIEWERESVTWLQTGEEVAQGAPATRKKPLTNTNTNEIWTRSTCIRRYWIVLCVLVNEGGWMWKCEYKNGFWLPTPASIYTRPAMPETGMFLQMRIILLLANFK